MDLEKFKEKAASQFAENKKFLHSLRKQKSRLDEAFHAQHEAVFADVDCLACANCCKTTSPIFTLNDIDRLAKVFKQKPQAFIDDHLRLDEEGDYVLQSSPCVFLGEDNKCLVYDARPKACREYPHTNRKRMYQILTLTAENTRVCPAVLEVVNELKKL